MSRSRYASPLTRTALTLLELVVVLGILAVLSTVAVRSLEPIADHARYELSKTLLSDLRKAIAGDDTHRASFIGDAGSLPTDVDSLLNRPVSINAHALQSFDSDRDNINDVTLSSGWNGPYLQLGVGLDEVLDGWGVAPTLVENSGDLEISSLGSDADSVSPEDGYRADLTTTILSREYTGDVTFRLFEIDALNGQRIDPVVLPDLLLNPRLGVLFYGVNATGGTNGAITEQMLIVPVTVSFEHRRTNTLLGNVAARAVLWNDTDNDNSLDVAETIVKKSYVHYFRVQPAADDRIEMELR